MKWYLDLGSGDPDGPLSEERIREWIKEGMVTYHMKICEVGSSEWESIGQNKFFQEEFKGTPPPPPMSKDSSGTTGNSTPNANQESAQDVSKGMIVFTIILVLGACVVIYKCQSSPSRNSNDVSESQIPDAECKQDAQCWGEKHLASATVACGKPIERMAQYSYEWTSTLHIFAKWRYVDKTNGTITYIGDDIKFQNGFGAFQIHTYECDFDPTSGKVLDVRVNPGQLE